MGRAGELRSRVSLTLKVFFWLLLTCLFLIRCHDLASSQPHVSGVATLQPEKSLKSLTDSPLQNVFCIHSLDSGCDRNRRLGSGAESLVQIDLDPRSLRESSFTTVSECGMATGFIVTRLNNRLGVSVGRAHLHILTVTADRKSVV